MADLEQDAPGRYCVVLAAIVKEAAATNSERVGELPIGTEFDVLEVVMLEDAQRVRGRIADPPGWVSLMNMTTGERWAVKASPPAKPRAGDRLQITSGSVRFGEFGICMSAIASGSPSPYQIRFADGGTAWFRAEEISVVDSGEEGDKPDTSSADTFAKLKEQGTSFFADANITGAINCWAEALHLASSSDDQHELRMSLIKAHSRRGEWQQVLSYAEATTVVDTAAMHWRTVALGRLKRWEEAEAALVAFEVAAGDAGIAGRTRADWKRARGADAGPVKTMPAAAQVTQQPQSGGLLGKVGEDPQLQKAALFIAGLMWLMGVGVGYCLRREIIGSVPG